MSYQVPQLDQSISTLEESRVNTRYAFWTPIPYADAGAHDVNVSSPNIVHQQDIPSFRIDLPVTCTTVSQQRSRITQYQQSPSGAVTMECQSIVSVVQYSETHILQAQNHSHGAVDGVTWGQSPAGGHTLLGQGTAPTYRPWDNSSCPEQPQYSTRAMNEGVSAVNYSACLPSALPAVPLPASRPISPGILPTNPGHPSNTSYGISEASASRYATQQDWHLSLSPLAPHDSSGTGELNNQMYPSDSLAYNMPMNLPQPGQYDVATSSIPISHPAEDGATYLHHETFTDTHPMSYDIERDDTAVHETSSFSDIAFEPSEGLDTNVSALSTTTSTAQEQSRTNLDVELPISYCRTQI